MDLQLGVISHYILHMHDTKLENLTFCVTYWCFNIKYSVKHPCIRENLPACDQSRSPPSCLSTKKIKIKNKIMVCCCHFASKLCSLNIYIFTACKPSVWLCCTHLLPQMSYTWGNVRRPVFFYAEHWDTVLCKKKQKNTLDLSLPIDKINKMLKCVWATHLGQFQTSPWVVQHVLWAFWDGSVLCNF